MLKETRTTRLVKGEDLNHHGTLFAGRMSEWLVESCFLAAARFVGAPEDIVCVKIHGLTFTKPAHPGDSIEIVSLPVRTGTKSLTVGAEVFINDEIEPTVRGYVTFVTVDGSGKSYAHGLSLPPAWIEAHRGLCEEAEALKMK
jgi:Acyl-CoA hydrolase